MITLELIQLSEVRALSWKQPYASAMLPPNDKVETRVWDAKYRGLVLICASLRGYSWAEVEQMSGIDNQNRLVAMFEEEIIDTGKRLSYNDPINFLPLGMAIGIGELFNSMPMNLFRTDLHKKFVERKTFIQWDQKLWMHEYLDVIPIVPFPWKGSQGWRKLTDEQKQLIKLL